MKKISVIILAVFLMLSFNSCGIANGTHGGIVKSESWPLTDYSEPENCSIVSVEKNYNGITVTVVWDSMDDAKAYTKILQKECGKDDSAPNITENDEEYTYTSYTFTVSYSSKEERLNYIHIY